MIHGAPSPTNHGSPRRPRVPAPFFHMGTALRVSASSAKGGEGKTTEDGKKFGHQWDNIRYSNKIYNYSNTNRARDLWSQPLCWSPGFASRISLQVAPKAGERQRCWVDVKVLHYLYQVVKTIQWVWSLRFQNCQLCMTQTILMPLGLECRQITMDAKV